MLTLPDIRQTTDYDCGAVAIDVLCRFYGKRERGPVKLANYVQGMAPDTVEAVLRSLGFRILAGTITIGDLRHLTKTRPVLVCRSGHWEVVRGVYRGLVYFQCPERGPVKLSITQFDEAWHDTTNSGHVYDHYGLCAQFP